jgi:hypothetical protein
LNYFQYDNLGNQIGTSLSWGFTGKSLTMSKIVNSNQQVWAGGELSGYGVYFNQVYDGFNFQISTNLVFTNLTNLHDLAPDQAGGIYFSYKSPANSFIIGRIKGSSWISSFTVATQSSASASKIAFFEGYFVAILDGLVFHWNSSWNQPIRNVSASPGFVGR